MKHFALVDIIKSCEASRQILSMSAVFRRIKKNVGIEAHLYK